MHPGNMPRALITKKKVNFKETDCEEVSGVFELHVTKNIDNILISPVIISFLFRTVLCEIKIYRSRLCFLMEKGH